jgi:hypothetical protein
VFVECILLAGEVNQFQRGVPLFTTGSNWFWPERVSKNTLLEPVVGNHPKEVGSSQKMD